MGADPPPRTVKNLTIWEWVAFPFSSGTSQSRNQTRVSCIAGRVFTNWAMREALCIKYSPASWVLLYPRFCIWGVNQPQMLSMHACMLSCSVVSDFLRPCELYTTKLLHPWNFPDKNTGAGCYFFLLAIFPTQGLNPCLLHLLQYCSIYCWELNLPVTRPMQLQPTLFKGQL